MSDHEAIERKIDNAIYSALAHEGEVVNRWISIVETIDQQGERALWTFTSSGMKRWDSLGLLHYAVSIEQAAEIKET